MNAPDELSDLAIPFIEAHNQSAWAQYTLRVANRESVQQLMKEKGYPQQSITLYHSINNPLLLTKMQNYPLATRSLNT